MYSYFVALIHMRLWQQRGYQGYLTSYVDISLFCKKMCLVLIQNNMDYFIDGFVWKVIKL
ncbi:MAG: hypothetical protein DHS20C08_06750 [Rhodomicrobium sp.]|nr:MAG: hypothetical protein DHS20C08_06750 [Rhodomicrobium sp.]